MAATIGLAQQVGAQSACASLGISRASFYRHLAPLHGPRPAPSKAARALSPNEHEIVLGLLYSQRLQDHSPIQVAASLLDEGQYHCSSRIMYWTYSYLYVVLEVFSRYVVGWMIAHRKSAELAKQPFEDTCRKQSIPRDQLTVPADRGSSMTSKPVSFLLSDLGVTKTHISPHVSNDNSYSEG